MTENQEKYRNALKIQREIAESLNKETKLEDIMQSALDRLLKLMALSTGWIFLTEDKEFYELIADRNLPPALENNREYLMTCRNGASDCKCMALYHQGELNEAVNHVKCARLDKALKHSLGDTRKLSHHASIPLIVRGKKLGLLNLASSGKKSFDEEELVMLETAAYQIGIAIDRYKLQEERKKLILERERNRLARDLHDSVKQKLFALSLTARGLENMITDERSSVYNLTRDITDLSKDALTDMNRLIWELKPLDFEDDLETAFFRYAEKIGVELTISSDVDLRMKNIDEQILWKIGQEALNNIKKHAGTDAAELRMLAEDDHFEMTVKDRGRGGAKESAYNLGLKSIKERVHELRGELNIDSKRGHGTTITISIPI